MLKINAHAILRLALGAIVGLSFALSPALAQALGGFGACKINDRCARGADSG
jgi:hypothetical protein